MIESLKYDLHQEQHRLYEEGGGTYWLDAVSLSDMSFNLIY